MTGDALKSFAARHFTVVQARSTVDELVILCPTCGGGDQSGNRSVNVRNGMTHCWKCEKNSGSFAWLARKLGLTVEDDKPMAKPLSELTVKKYAPPASLAPPVLSIKLPDGFIPCSERPNSYYTELIGEMAARKNLTIEDFIAAGVGYTKTNTLWEPYAIFPVVDYGRVVYYQGRTYIDKPGESTKRFPSRQEVSNGSMFWVYNIDEVRRKKAVTVIVMESILNVLSVKKVLAMAQIDDAVPVAVFKHAVSAPQAHKILVNAHVREICLLYDRDASRTSWMASPQLADRTVLSIAEMPEGPGGAKNDPNDDAEAAVEAFLCRIRYSGKNAMLQATENLLASQQSRSAAENQPEQPDFDPLANLGLIGQYGARTAADEEEDGDDDNLRF